MPAAFMWMKQQSGRSGIVKVTCRISYDFILPNLLHKHHRLEYKNSTLKQIQGDN